VARFHLIVSQPGTVVLKVQGHEGISARLDGKPIELKNEVPLALTAGRHTVTFVSGSDKPADQNLRVELGEGNETTAKVRVVGRR
jgi:hypothetical protein